MSIYLDLEKHERYCRRNRRLRKKRWYIKARKRGTRIEGICSLCNEVVERYHNFG